MGPIRYTNGLLFSLLPEYFRIHLTLECRKNGIRIQLDYSGDKLNLEDLIREKGGKSDAETIEDDHAVSSRIIRRYASEFSFSFSPGVPLPNRLVLGLAE